MEEKQVLSGRHRISMENRKKCSLNGVTDVISFDLAKILLETELGMLEIQGKNLHVNHLSVEKGEVEICGEFDSFAYTEVKKYAKKAETLFDRMFK